MAGRLDPVAGNRPPRPGSHLPGAAGAVRYWARTPCEALRIRTSAVGDGLPLLVGGGPTWAVAATLHRYGMCTVGRVARVPLQTPAAGPRSRAMARLVRERASGIDPRPVTATALPQASASRRPGRGHSRPGLVGREILHAVVKGARRPREPAHRPSRARRHRGPPDPAARCAHSPGRVLHSNRVAAHTDNSNLLDKFFCRMDPGYTRQPRTAACGWSRGHQAIEEPTRETEEP